MRSMIYWGDVSHVRREPRKHGFTYPLFTFALDLDELDQPFFRGRLLAHNRFGAFSLWDSDYLDEERGGIRERLDRWLAAEHGMERPHRVTLLTMPRVLGYIFNPVSFYICEHADGTLHSLLTEVNNTFGEKHLYLSRPESPGASLPLTFEFDKRFFVSPFFPVDGFYRLSLERAGSDFRIKVELVRGAEAVFSATLRGSGEELTSGRILKTLSVFPLTALLTMGRIYRQAAVLYFRRSVTIYRKPAPSSAATVRSSQRLVHRLRLWVLRLGKRSDDTVHE